MILEIDKLLVSLIMKTKRKKIDWKRVANQQYSKLIDRNIPTSVVKEAYYTIDKDSDDLLIIGRGEKQKYVDEDEYYFSDYYFIAFADENFDNAVTFLDNDVEVQDNEVSIDMARLYRLVKLTNMKVDEKLNKWIK